LAAASVPVADEWSDQALPLPLVAASVALAALLGALLLIATLAELLAKLPALLLAMPIPSAHTLAVGFSITRIAAVNIFLLNGFIVITPKYIQIASDVVLKIFNRSVTTVYCVFGLSAHL